MDKRILSRAGLSKGEIEVYLTLLKRGASPVSAIAKSTGLHRTNIYDTLEKLREKGLVSHVVRGGGKHFSASAPVRLVDYLKEREEEVRSVLPELSSYARLPRSEASVEIYQGKEGMKTVLKDILEEGKDYCVFEEEGHIERALPHFFAQFNARLDRAGIRVRALAKGPIATRKGMALRTLPEFIAFPAATAVYGSKVAIFVWDEPYHAILIRSAQVAGSYRNFFELLWRQAGSMRPLKPALASVRKVR
jgi:sugar-specific transcriptional regulator TrmB